MGALIAGFFCMTFFSYVFLGFSLLDNNQKISEDMITSIARSRVSYFDINSSGRLINRFSNDVGVLDHSTLYSFE